MKIVHCIVSIDKNAGGTATACIELVNKLAYIIETIYVVTLESKSPLQDSIKNGKVFFAKNTFLGFSTAVKKQLNILEADILHGHGLWDLIIHQMSCIAIEKKIPYIISIHGMLEPWSLKQSVIKKNLAKTLYQHRDLVNASCIHATAWAEVENIRRLGYTNPIAMIPNGIDLKEYPLKDYTIKKVIKKILFLSRIHPKKGIEFLINAWEQLDKTIRKNWEIEIAGNGSSEYIEQLNKLIDTKGLLGQIRIVGSKFGAEKLAIYHTADLFVLPTYSENFGIVIAEALCCGVPVITTKGAPWVDIENFDTGRWIDIGAEHLKASLLELMVKTDDERKEMGLRGRDLIVANYSIDAAAYKMEKLYQWILNGGEPPEFIDLSNRQ